MTLVVRADASDVLGTGHLMRCRSVAERLGFPATDTLLVTASLPPGLRRVASAWGWQVVEIGALSPAEDARATADVLGRPGSARALLLDHYGLDASWEAAVGCPGLLTVVIDDLRDRPHECDVLIDPSVDAGRVPGADSGSHALLLLGPRYAPLSPAYDDVTPRRRTGRPRELLVFLGGGTGGRDLLPLLDSLDGLSMPLDRTTVVLGHAFTDRTLVHARALSVPGVTVLDSVDSMLPLLQSADLAIGAPGGAQWERCAVGVPTLTVLTHPNQARDCASFEAAGATRHLGDLRSMSVDHWRRALQASLADHAGLAAMGAAAASLVDGRQDAWEAARTSVQSRLPTVEGGSS